eukprot:16443987-Heterocapsa_arctica.AAC.1
MSSVNTDKQSGRASPLLPNLNETDILCECVNGKNVCDNDWKSSSRHRKRRVKYKQFTEATAQL